MHTLAFIPLAIAFIGAGEATYLNSSDTQATSKIICNISGYSQNHVIDPYRVADGIRHLKGLSGNATLGHQDGGGWCHRYSCSSNAGIYACNDNQFDIEVPWSTLADYAQQVKDKCTWQMKNDRHIPYTVQGQAFDSDGWNVIIGLKDGTSC